jgi:transmembrane 9 superfamily protein 1
LLDRPYNNPSETYRYYSLPFCHEHEIQEYGDQEDDDENKGTSEASDKDASDTTKKVGALSHRQRLGESLIGNRRESTPYILKFGDSVEDRVLCSKTLTTDEIQIFKDAIHDSFFFEMYVEDLPMWGYVGDVMDEDVIIGEVEGYSHTYLFTNLIFEVGKNNDQIVSVSLRTDTDKRVDITKTDKPIDVTFTYQVRFFDDPTPWNQRMQKYAGSEFMPKALEIHWLSIINAVVLILLLLAFLTIIIMRILKNDLTKYMEIEDESLEEEEVRYPSRFLSQVYLES